MELISEIVDNLEEHDKVTFKGIEYYVGTVGHKLYFIDRLCEYVDYHNHNIETPDYFKSMKEHVKNAKYIRDNQGIAIFNRETLKYLLTEDSLH